MCKEGIRIGRGSTLKSKVAPASAGLSTVAIGGNDPTRIAVTLAFGSPVIAAGDFAVLQAKTQDGFITFLSISPDSPAASANVEWWGQFVTSDLQVVVQSTAGIIVHVGMVTLTQNLDKL